jgi:hypothetical protein
VSARGGSAFPQIHISSSKTEPAGFDRLRRVLFGDGDGKLTDNF